MATPASTPSRSSASVVKVELSQLDFQDFPYQDELSFSYQSSWPIRTTRQISAYIVAFKPNDPREWIVKICPTCLEYEKSCECSTKREIGYYLALDLKSDISSQFTLRAYIYGSEAEIILQSHTVNNMFHILNDARKHCLPF